ncbi:MAG TPA: hypothetical protein VE821_00645, partial [Pyrinomonadaceae bacterium]|nr:hypothetical protein [Pyrinomonadaceae bacterium]
MGCVLYELIAGVTPFEGETPSDCIAAILKTEPPPLSAIAPATPPKLEGLIGKALHKDGDERYQTAVEMLADLRGVKQELDARAQLERSAPARVSGFTPATGGAQRATEESTATPIGAHARTTSSAEYIIAEIKQHKLGVLLTLALLVVAVAGVVSYFYLTRGDSLAVMPFAYVSTDPNVLADPDREYLSDGITESIINDLSQASNLKVIARSSVLRYKGQEVDPQKVGQELGVRTTLTGRI